MLRAGIVKQAHQPRAVRAWHFVAEAVSALVFLAQAWEVRIELLIKIFPVAVPEGKPHAEAEDAAHARFHTIGQYAAEVFLRVVQKGKDGGKPYYSRDARITELEERFKAFARRAYVRFENAAERFVKCCECHLHDTLAFFMNAA